MVPVLPYEVSLEVLLSKRLFGYPEIRGRDNEPLFPGPDRYPIWSSTGVFPYTFTVTETPTVTSRHPHIVDLFFLTDGW